MIQARSFAASFATPALLALVCAALAAPSSAAQRREMPDTTVGVHIFNDQTAAWTQELVEFTARRYAGTQKQTRAEADALRAIAPGFVILHYRLGMGLGYRVTDGNCVQNGSYYSIIDGTWVQEWPGDAVVQSSWHHHHLGLQTIYCTLGWFLMELDHPGYRQWWSEQVMSQMDNNDNDGLFADSFMVPNFLATNQWSPPFPGLDLVLEAVWTAKLESFMTYLRQRFGEDYYLIPNIGTWVTTRDQTDYSIADGVFIEYFANEPFNNWGFAGWSAQADRLLGLIGLGRIVIGQTNVVQTAEQRMFALGTYLLLKGERTYLNFELGMAPEWFPEYEVPIGAPTSSGASVSALLHPGSGLYQRTFSNGLVLVNPTAQTRVMTLPQAMHLAQPTGGGNVPSNGVLPTSWRIDYSLVQQVTLAPGRAAVLVHDPAAGAPHTIGATVFSGGQVAEVSVSGGTPGGTQSIFFTRSGLGSTPFASLNVTLSLSSPRRVAIIPTDAAGSAHWTITVPQAYSGVHLWLQAAEQGSTTNVIERMVN